MSISLVSRGMLVPNFGGTSVIPDHGSIEIEIGWQMITVPIQFGYWDVDEHKHIHDITIAKIKNYVLDQIEDIMGDTANKFVEVTNTYFGDIQAFYNFFPNHTNPNSIHNFPLTFIDGTKKEYTAFWIKNIHSSPITISWGQV